MLMNIDRRNAELFFFLIATACLFQSITYALAIICVIGIMSYIAGVES
jgi:hypothetical protein